MKQQFQSEYLQYQLFHQELMKKVKEYFSKETISSKANLFFYIKAIIWLSLIIVFYFIFLLSQFTIFKIISGIFCGLSWLFFLINVAHDAAHFSVFKTQKYNKWLYNISFLAMGNCPSVWQKNHCNKHHISPNVIGKDPDVIETPLLRFHNDKPCKSFHRYQVLYAPILYLLHSPIYFFITEPILMLNKNIKMNFMDRIYTILGKIFFLILMVYLPFKIGSNSLDFYLLLFVVIQMLYSLILVFGLGISHLNTKTLFVSNQKMDLDSIPPIKIQLLASADYNCENSFTHFLLGGFNTHGLHHLFPSVNHIHYKNLFPILVSTSKQYNIPYQTYTYWDLFKSHFKLLYLLGKNESELTKA